MRQPLRRWEWAAIAAITAGAAVLRLVAISRVSPDPFYDAAVRSMSLSFHNFFLGAYEPSATVSIDKPPIDLWFQVASVKLFGFSSTALKLPEVLGGVVAVPLLFAAVRRMWSGTAGIAAALALAVMPIEVITSRSDTMDAVMMALLVLALLLLVRAVETDGIGWLIAAAVALGVAFNVKLLESLVAVPGLALFAYLGLAGPHRRRLPRLALAGAVYVAVSLSWLTATLLVPAHERPFAIGSTNGSAWNAAFVFNGTDRLRNVSPEPNFTVYIPGHHYPEATQAQRDAIPIVPPSATRLLARIGPLSGQRLGLELLIGLLLGVPALVFGAIGRDERGTLAADSEAAASTLRMRRATAGGIGLWTLTGIVLFSHQSRLHPRYVESFTPAVAALLGIGIAWVAVPRGRARLVALAVAAAATVFYSQRLLYGYPAPWWIALLAAIGALACALLGRAWAGRDRTDAEAAGGRSRQRCAFAACAGVTMLMLVAVLAVPLRADVTAIHEHTTSAGYVGAIPPGEQRLISAYTRAHQGSARFQLAAESATGVASLIVKDARPVLMLTSYEARVLTDVAKLKALIAAGKVRYAFLNSTCGRHFNPKSPACSPPAVWVAAHATDVSAAAGLSRRGVLWKLPGAAA
jgi:4-amino-4-deoxy-L-arabinose transferase-like glycosyltransferase